MRNSSSKKMISEKKSRRSIEHALHRPSLAPVLLDKVKVYEALLDSLSTTVSPL
jgi:hypothetical protein